MRGIRIATAAVLAAAMGAAGGAGVADEGTEAARAVVETAIETMIGAAPEARTQAIAQIVETHVHTRLIAARSVGKKVWNAASDAQRARLTGALRRVLVRTYAAAVSAAGEDTRIEIGETRASDDGKRRITSVTVTPGSGRPIALAYTLRAHSGGWKVEDMAVDGVSLTRGYRASFRAVIRQHGIEGLIEQVEAKAREGDDG